MIDAMEIVFWATATHIVQELLVPIIGLIVGIGIFYTALGLGARK